ncbi:MAG: DUF4236 domain-containing protein [Ruminococcus sp.]|nr:DUF4236 domain-containing protein [Ruminococcus sp.]
MGLNFRKSFKIAPGVRLNVGKKGGSVSFGGKGAKFTVNSKGRRTTTVKVPGTGLSYSTSSGGSKKRNTSSTKKRSTSSTRTTTNSTRPVTTNSVRSSIPQKSAGVPLHVLLAIVIPLVVIFGSCFIMTGIMAVLSPDDEPIENLESTSISADDFAAKFSADETAAVNECKNNIYEITGEFDSITNNELVVSTNVIAAYSNTYDLSFELAEGQTVPDDMIPGCSVTVKGRFKRLSNRSLEFNGSILISHGEVKLFGIYDAVELAHLMDDEEKFEESIKGKYIQITGEVKENTIYDGEIHLFGESRYSGWYQCEMLDKLEVNDVEPGNIATIQGRVESTFGNYKMNYCKLISAEEPTTQPPTAPPTTEALISETEVASTKKTTTTPTRIQITYWINTDSGKFHHSRCRTIKNKNESYWTTRTCERKELINQGYSPCGVCDP